MTLNSSQKAHCKYSDKSYCNMFKVKDIILAKSRRKGSVDYFLKKYKNTINMIEYNNITHNSMTKKNNNRQTHPADPHDTSDASISRERFGRDRQTDSQSVRRGFHHQGPSHRRRRHAVHDEHEKEGAQRGRACRYTGVF